MKRWSKFKVILQTAGWDDKWVYHVHYFEQKETVMAIGVTRALIWKRDVPHILEDIIREAGGSDHPVPPPEWVKQLFVNDKKILESQFRP